MSRATEGAVLAARVHAELRRVSEEREDLFALASALAQRLEGDGDGDYVNTRLAKLLEERLGDARTIEALRGLLVGGDE